MKRKLTCSLLICTMLFSLCAISVSGDTISTTENKNNKMSVKLQNTIEELDDHEKIDVAVWLDDYDESIYENAFTASLKEYKSKNVISTDIDTARELFYSDTINTEQTLKINETQELLEIKNISHKSLTYGKNNEWVNNTTNTLSEEAELIYVSKYSPSVIMSVTKSDLDHLIKSENVQRIYEWKVESLVYDDINNINNVTKTDDETPDYGVWQNITNIYTLRNVMGYTGRNIKVGMLEPGIPIDASNYSNITTLNEGTGEYYAEMHASYIASILIGNYNNFTGVAPNITLFCAGPENYDIVSSIELLLNENINILNLSMSFGEKDSSTADIYDFYAEYLDYIVTAYNIVVCKSAGNSNVYSGIHKGGMSYNSIVVGNINDNNTLTLEDDILDESSLYSIKQDIAIKPDLCAPGSNAKTCRGINITRGGTSAAAAITSGTCALLMEANPQLIGKPMLVKSILLTSAKRIPNMDPTNSLISTITSYLPAISRQYGAGMIDAMQAYNLATASNKWFYYSNPEIINSNVSYGPNITITQGNINLSKKLIISFCWNKNVNYTNSNTQILHNYHHTIEVYDPNETLVAQSTYYYDSKQFIYYTPTIPGIYKIRVVKSDDNNAIGSVGALSYRIGN